MPLARGNPRRPLYFLFAGCILVFLIVFYTNSAPNAAAVPLVQKTAESAHTSEPGRAIAKKMGNETIKAELGRAAWKVLHTTMAQFPDKPTAEESATLRTFIHSFQRVYPCGECAEHFGELLKKFPPQVSSRSAAAVWACHVHNQVNERLKKDMFDCANIGDFYDCGCADDDEKKGSGQTDSKDKPEMSAEAKAKLVTGGRDLNMDLFV